MLPQFTPMVLVNSLMASSVLKTSFCEAFAPALPGKIDRGHLPLESLLTLRAGATDAETFRESTSTESSALFKFYTLENGMCPYAARTWITFIELGLPFEIVGVNALKKADWFLEINPRGKVPAIQNTEDGTVLYESAICDEYLSDLTREMEKGAPCGQKMWKLMPIDASERAALRLLNNLMDNTLLPAQFTFLMNKDEEKDFEMIVSLESALDVLQDSLIKRGGPYLMGGGFSLADIHVLPFFLRLIISLKHFKGYEVPKQKYSRLLEWFDLCSERESVQATAKSEEEIIKVYKMFVEKEYGFGGLNKNK